MSEIRENELTRIAQEMREDSGQWSVMSGQFLKEAQEKE
jgi:hypothetical protein